MKLLSLEALLALSFSWEKLSFLLLRLPVALSLAPSLPLRKAGLVTKEPVSLGARLAASLSISQPGKEAVESMLEILQRIARLFCLQCWY